MTIGRFVTPTIIGDGYVELRMDASNLFNTDTEHWEDKSTTEQISYVGDNLPRIAGDFGKSIEELEHRMEEGNEEMKKRVALENTKVELQKLVSVIEIADRLLEKLDMEITTSIIKEDFRDDDALIEDLAEILEVDLDLEDNIDVEDVELKQYREIPDDS